MARVEEATSFRGETNGVGCRPGWAGAGRYWHALGPDGI